MEKERQSQSHVAVGMQRRFDGKTQLLMASIAVIPPRSMLDFATSEVLILSQTLIITARACGSPNMNMNHNDTLFRLQQPDGQLCQPSEKNITGDESTYDPNYLVVAIILISIGPALCTISMVNVTWCC